MVAAPDRAAIPDSTATLCLIAVRSTAASARGPGAPAPATLGGAALAPAASQPVGVVRGSAVADIRRWSHPTGCQAGPPPPHQPGARDHELACAGLPSYTARRNPARPTCPVCSWVTAPAPGQRRPSGRGGQVPRRRTWRIASGTAASSADAPIGAPTPLAARASDPPTAASAAARLCRNAAQPAAHHGSRPAASNAPMIPDNTSPEPAVAAHEEPAGSAMARPAGSATTVTLPLSSTVA